MKEDADAMLDLKAQRLKELLDLVDESEISSIKSTVSELIRLINDPKSSAKDLKEVIQLDPPLTAKLLKLANSAYYGFPRTIGDIQEAVVCVGFNELKELALNQKISQLFNQSDDFAGYSRTLLWKHSVAVAVCGKLIYTKELNLPGGNAYVCGLIHDIGIIIEDQFLLDTFFQILDSYGARESDFTELEQQNLGYDHTDIGHEISVDWNFPDEISQAIKYHHNIEQAPDEAQVLTYVLFIANAACQSKDMGFGDIAEQNLNALRASMDKLNSRAGSKLNDNSLDTILDEVQENITKMEKAGWF
jgi:putative nucleotidyltransferase with HDIG domain